MTRTAPKASIAETRAEAVREFRKNARLFIRELRWPEPGYLGWWNDLHIILWRMEEWAKKIARQPSIHQIASNGGRARAKKLSAARRRAIARTAARARWSR